MADSPTADAAVAAALAHNWKDAIRINTELLKANTNDIATLNRLGHAYAQEGDHRRAKSLFEQVLKLDPYNQIARKHLKSLPPAKKKSPSIPAAIHVSPLSFLEEPGITKIVNCVNLAPSATIDELSPGMELILKPRNHCVEVRAFPNTYVAALPDDISYKLIRLINSGNQYRAFVKGVGRKSLVLLIREIARGKKFAGQPSFTAPRLGIAQSLPDAMAEQSDDTPNGATGSTVDVPAAEEGESD